MEDLKVSNLRSQNRAQSSNPQRQKYDTKYKDQSTKITDQNQTNSLVPLHPFSKFVLASTALSITLVRAFDPSEARLHTASEEFTRFCALLPAQAVSKTLFGCY